MSLFNELKRRNVFRVGIGYAIVAWLVLQVADLVLENISAPGWVMQTIMLIVAIGLPLVLIFAWAFELTPEGLKRDADVDRSDSISGQTSRKLDRAIIVVLVIALAYFIWERQAGGPDFGEEPTDSTKTEATLDKSIAVLPFVNMSADADNEYFSDGLSEELLNLLAKVDGLKVAARTSSFKFKGSEADISDIGQQLNVATVLEGSVRKAGNDVRITAQLIKVDDGFHLWSETYDRSLDNIFQVQGEIAGHIVDALKLPLLGQDAQPLAPTATANVEAYDLYLLGRHHTRSLSEASLERAIDYFNQATSLDPEFAPAWAGLAQSHLWMADFGGMSTQTAMELAAMAIERAMTIDPDEPDVLMARALLTSWQDRNSDAVSLLEQVLRINPNHISAMINLADLIWAYDADRASSLTFRAYELDPLDERTRAGFVRALASQNQLMEAEEQAQQFLLEDPDNPMNHEMWGNILWFHGQPHKAIPKYEMAHRLRPGDAFPAATISQLYLQLEDLESAREWAEVAAERTPVGVYGRVAQYRLAWYQQDWESLQAAYNEAMTHAPAESMEDPGFMYFVGNLALRQGDREKAERTYRQVLKDRGFEDGQISDDDMANAVAALINILPAGPERDELIASLENFQSYLQQHYGWWGYPYRVKAWLATFRDDREGAIAALSDAIDHNLSYTRSVEMDLILARWQNDPLFKEQVLRMRQIADERRAQLEAGP